MSVEDLFNILLNKVLNSKSEREKNDSKKRFTEAVKSFEKFQMKTGPPPPPEKKKKKLEKGPLGSFQKFEYHLFMSVASFLTYDDLKNYLQIHPAIYLIMIEINQFWEEKFKKEFMGFDYPNNLIMPMDYLLVVLGKIKFFDKKEKDIKEAFEKGVEEVLVFLNKTEWYRKTIYFLKKLKQINEVFEIDPPFYSYQQHMQFLNIISPEDVLYTQESFVVGLILFYDYYHVITYIEKQKKNLNLKILLKAANMGYYNLTRMVEYTKYSFYEFDRKKFLMESKNVAFPSLGNFTHEYYYLRGDYDVAKRAITEFITDIEYVTNKRIKNDPDIAWAAVKKRTRLFMFLGDDIRNKNKKLCEYVLKENGFMLKFCGPDIKDDERLVTIAAMNEIKSLKYAGNILRHDINFMLKLIRMEEIQHQLGELYIKDLRKILTGSNIKNNPEFMYLLIKENYRAFNFIGEELKKNKKYIRQLKREFPILI